MSKWKALIEPWSSPIQTFEPVVSNAMHNTRPDTFCKQFFAYGKIQESVLVEAKQMVVPRIVLTLLTIIPVERL